MHGPKTGAVLGPKSRPQKVKPDSRASLFAVRIWGPKASTLSLAGLLWRAPGSKHAPGVLIDACTVGLHFLWTGFGSQDGPRFGDVSGKSIRKNHYYLATDLIRCNVEIEIQNMVSIRWKLSGWKTCFSEPENPIHPRIFGLLVHRRWARPNLKHIHWHGCNNETQLLTS